MASNFHITLPPQTPYNMKSGSRRTPLTPSTITPPSLNAHTPSAMKPENGSPTRAETLLAKVAQHTAHRKGTPPTSPMASPNHGSGEQQAAPLTTDQWQRTHQRDAQRSWANQRKQDGYISFPDFEKYCPQYSTGAQESRREPSSVAG